MRKISKSASLLAVTGLFVIAVLFAGCTRHPSEEEMKQLNDLKAEVASLEKQVSDRQGAKANLEKQIAAKDDKLKWCAGEKEIVKQRVANWK
jgi:septal ring factor EnvC (AmiA/AmiB activator)